RRDAGGDTQGTSEVPRRKISLEIAGPVDQLRDRSGGLAARMIGIVTRAVSDDDQRPRTIVTDGSKGTARDLRPVIDEKNDGNGHGRLSYSTSYAPPEPCSANCRRAISRKPKAAR